MCELSPSGGDPALLRRSFAGDAANAAVALRRAAGDGVAVDFFSAVGTDSLSDEMLGFLESEGIGTRLVRRDSERTVGLYWIREPGGASAGTGPAASGEGAGPRAEIGGRSFLYWRERSAARRMLDAEAACRALGSAAESADLLFFTGVTLAILPPAALATLLEVAAKARDLGAVVAFDSNFRPPLWRDAATARIACEAAWRVATVALPSLDDEVALLGERRSDATTAVLDRLRGAGLEEGAVKDGARGVVVFRGDEEAVSVPAPQINVVDATGAGDAFDGVYLARRLAGDEPVAAARRAVAAASRAVTFHGAIPPAAPV